jgi:TRAP transporter TAXI family solute receptor
MGGDRLLSMLTGVLHTLLATSLLLLPVTLSADNHTQSMPVFRLGTGGSSGSYFPIGSIVAQEISQHADVLALAQRSNGSASNVRDIDSGLLEAALAQADVVHWAYNGTEEFSDSDPINSLRTVATLYLESLHFVVRSDSGIESLDDLPGKRVSTDEIGSGTQLNVQQVLRSQGLAEEDIKLVYLKPIDAIDRFRRGSLDAFFVVAGYPVNGVTELIETGIGKVLPLEISIESQLLIDSPFLTVDEIPANTYGSSGAVTTLAVPAQLIVDASLDNDLIYRITRTLWDNNTLQQLSENHPKGSEVALSSALTGLVTPLHPGAAKFYVERKHPGLNRLDQMK